MIKYVENITKMNQNIQNQKLRLFARIDVETKIKIMQLQKATFYKIKSIHTDIDNTILTLSSLILAIDEVTKNLDALNLNVIKIRTKNNKSKVKRQKLIEYWAIVKTLKLEQNMSFRQISEYFAKYHKFDVSYSTIYEIWNDLENNKKEKEN